MKKIAVVGPESTGKSTLCEDMSVQYNIDFVKEYAREYLTALDRNYIEKDLQIMANEQFRRIQMAADRNTELVIADTEVLTIKIWSQIKYGRCHNIIESLLSDQKFDYYLLCDTDIPWQEDPLREVPDHNLRRKIFDLFKSEMERFNWSFQVISGQRHERLKKAVSLIDSF